MFVLSCGLVINIQSLLCAKKKKKVIFDLPSYQSNSYLSAVLFV